ncbi:hypothetical protein ACTMKN_04920 [Bacteroides pyogenes]|uniref:hypothetical protein n=1 Tax=Bacteroides pyogenes TaxID=310300 RepID=UPI0011E3FEB8|nr:hypothetical protein [Bacteroides pyogenes]TYK39907.1 hypothetical protein FNJ59_06515 [Bacteroides pyogenes]
MLDLNRLEQKLDEALEKETVESLTDWIMKKRAQSFSSFVCGTHDYTPMTVFSSEFSVEVTNKKERYNINMNNQISLMEELLIAS